MKKLSASILSLFGISSKAVQSLPKNVGPFEMVAKSSKATGDYMPAWECFVNTNFYVAVVRQDSGVQTRDFRFVVINSPQDDGKPCVIVSEELSRLESPQSSEAIKLSGGKLIELLNPEVGILVALSDGGFGVPVDLVQWLRASMQPAH